MLKHKIKKVWVDADECLAHYLCVGEAPNIFEKHDSEWTVQIRPGIDNKLLRKETENILWAAAICPVAAIKLELEDGEIVDGDSKSIQEFYRTNSKKNA